MGNRTRDTARFQDLKHFCFDCVDGLLDAEEEEGLYTTQVDSRLFDFLYEENGSDSDTLIVFFPGAATAKFRTYPMIAGRAIAKKAGLPILSFSDPVLDDAELTTSWMLGTEKTQFWDLIRRLVDKFAKGRRLIFTGISAGGYPALHLGNEYPESVSFVVNPRTSLIVPPTSFHRYVRKSFSPTSAERIQDYLPLEAPAPKNHVVFYQNAMDFTYYAGQAAPYFERALPGGRVAIAFGKWGDGHKPMPRDRLANRLRILAGARNWDDAVRGMALLKITDPFAARLRHYRVVLHMR